MSSEKSSNPSTAAFLVVLMIGCTQTLAAPAKDAVTLASLKSIYETNVARITSECDVALKAWKDNYTRDLQGLQKSLQKAGNFEGWQAASRELERFKSNPSLPAVPPDSLPAEVRKVQSPYGGIEAKTQADRNAKILALAESYIAHLTEMQKKLTIAGNMNEAAKYHVEIQRVKDSPAVTEAEFAAAATANAKTPAPTPAAETDERSSRESGAPEKPSPAAEATPAADAPAKDEEAATTLPAGVKVYDGQPAPALPGLSFKPVSMTASDRLKIGKKLASAVQMSERATVSKETDSGYYSTYQSRSGDVQHSLRIAMRATSSGYELANARMLVQVFARDLGAGAARVSPQVVATHLIPLPKIATGRSLIVDCPPFSLSVSSSKYTSEYYGSSTSRSGLDFYGVVVSVFDGAGTLVAQDVSNTSLNKLAAAECPDEVQPTKTPSHSSAPTRVHRTGTLFLP